MDARKASVWQMNEETKKRGEMEREQSAGVKEKRKRCLQ